MKALVVEDAKAARKALESLLRELPGIEEVLVAEFIAEARQVCRSFSPDIAVLDVLLPDGNGMELINPIRTANPKAGIVMLSHYEEIHRGQALHAGADMFLDKSAGFDSVCNALSMWVHNLAIAEQPKK